MTEIDKFCLTLSHALAAEKNKRALPQPFADMARVTNSLFWLGVQYAASAMLLDQEDEA